MLLCSDNEQQTGKGLQMSFPPLKSFFHHDCKQQWLWEELVTVTDGGGEG